MTPTEKSILLNFLEQLSNHFSNAGCNDLRLPNTPENQQLMRDVVEYIRHDIPDYDFKPRRQSLPVNDIITQDSWVLGYLIDKIKKEL